MDFRNFENPRVPQEGTFNGNPVAAAAGIATLKLIRDSDAIEQANRMTEVLRKELNRVISRAGVPWCCYGDLLGFHIFASSDAKPPAPKMCRRAA
jgi:glutamate-1-semialdehyde 2,1-aminomutase